MKPFVRGKKMLSGRCSGRWAPRLLPLSWFETLADGIERNLQRIHGYYAEKMFLLPTSGVDGAGKIKVIIFKFK